MEEGTAQGRDGEGPAYVLAALSIGLPLGVVSVADCCCLFTIPLLGALAARTASRPADWFGWQEGAVAGASAGAVAWLVQAVVKLPLMIFLPKFYASNPALLQGVPPAFREVLLRSPTPAELLGQLAVTLVIMLGGATFAGAVAGQLGFRKEPLEG